MFYISAMIAIVGAVTYQFFVKRVPASINPIVSLIGTYLAVLVLSVTLLPFFPAEGGLLKHVRKLSWVQLAVAASVFLLELGFLLMYRAGWDLSTGNLVTSVIVNLILLGLGFAILEEELSLINIAGAILSIIGVALIRHRP